MVFHPVGTSLLLFLLLACALLLGFTAYQVTLLVSGNISLVFLLFLMFFN